MNLEPLEVFALTSDMQRATGSIPYTSLMWNRKYYEVGDFLMEVPANVYDPSWAYIYTEERPETGIIQKVEYSDTSQVAGGVDTVILSGFFMEAELNRYTFLVEETEEEAYRIYKPAPAKTSKPTMWTDGEGNAYLKKGGKGGVPVRWETLEGEPVDTTKTDVSGFEEIPLEPGEGLKLIEYDTNNLDKFPSGKWNAGEYTNRNYSYYSEDGETLHSVAPDGTETTYDIVQGSGGDVIYRDAENKFHWVNGVASSLDGTYVRACDSWERMVNTEGLEVVKGDGTIMGDSTYARAYRTVKGPWQLRTDLDVNEPADNVQRIIQWAQDIYGNNLLYDEVGFAGEEKIIDPSLKLFGDLAYEELKTVGASPRLFYSFESDTCVFQVWRGLDRTQSQAGVPAPPTPDEPEPDEPSIEDLYEAVDYIQSDGGAYIDTGWTYGTANHPNVRLLVDAEFPASDAALDGCAVYTSFYVGTMGGNICYATGYGDKDTGVAATGRRAVYDLDLSARTFKVTETASGANLVDLSGIEITTPVVDASNFYLLAFANSTSGEANKHKGRLYASRIWENGSIIRDYVPMRRKADGVFGLLDLVNEVFYESASGVPFTGPSYPAGTYEELDCIVSTGEQYIDTGFKPNQDTSIIIDMQGVYFETTREVMFYGVGASPYFEVGKTSANWGIYAYYGSGATKLVTWDQASFINTRRTISHRGNVVEIDGVSYTLTQATFSCNYSMYICGVNMGGSLGYGTPMKVYACQIYDNGTPVRDYVPRRRVSDGAVGMLDLANGTFYESAGSEPFYAPGELPSGYTRLEYIESTGSQYIDTGFKPNQDTSVVIDMQGGNSAAANGTQMFYGVGSQPYFQFGKSSSSNWGIRAYYNATYTDPLATWDQSSFKSTRRTITQDKNKIEVDGISHEFTYAAFSCAYTMYLFGVNSADGFKFATAMKVYSCRIGDNGTIVRDYIPVRNSSGEAGLFDLVTMTFYADASGTGFVAGPEVAQVAEASAFSLMRTAAASNESNTAANPFAVFSDTWGTLYGFTASKDVSNYRNTCYVLYQFRDQTDADGNPIGPRGYVKARLEDELPDAETYLDLRGEEPEADQTDEAFIESLRQRGLAHLQANYAAIESLDTGTLAGNGYLTGYDLGDKVDMLVEAIGLVKEARITGVCEVHEAGSSTATLEIGEQKITNIRKAVIV